MDKTEASGRSQPSSLQSFPHVEKRLLGCLGEYPKNQASTGLLCSPTWPFSAHPHDPSQPRFAPSVRWESALKTGVMWALPHFAGLQKELVLLCGEGVAGTERDFILVGSIS